MILFCLFGVEYLIEHSRDHSADQRCDDKHPHLYECFGATAIDCGANSGSKATSRVDTGAGKIDADKVNKRQGEADDQTRNFAFVYYTFLTVPPVSNTILTASIE